MSEDKSKGTTDKDEVFEDGFLGAAVDVEDRSFGPQYPIMQWVNGDPKNKKQGGVPYTGGFFISTDQGVSAAVLEAAGFKAGSMMTKDGTEIPGFEAVEVTLSPIRYRRCWQVKAEGQLARRFGWDEYDAAQEEGKPRGVAHILCAIKGIDEPILVSFRGMTAKAVMGQGKERGVIPSYGATIIAQAKRAAKKGHKDINYPLCAFRLTICPETDGKNPKFTEVGKNEKSNVTLPVWKDAPEGEVDSALLQKLYVGAENLAKFQDWHKAADEWVDAWDADTLSGFRNRKGGGGGGETPAEGTDGTPKGNEMVF